MNDAHRDELVRSVSAARDGSTEAFRRVVQLTHARVYRVAYYVLGDGPEAEDVTQETFVQAWQRLDDLRDPSAVVSWLCRIARNRSLDRLKRGGRREVPVDVAALEPLFQALAGDDSNPERALESEEVIAAVRAALAALPEKHRTVLMLREVEGMTYEQISETLGLRVGTVESRLHRARKALAKRLKSLEGKL